MLELSIGTQREEVGHQPHPSTAFGSARQSWMVVNVPHLSHKGTLLLPAVCDAPPVTMTMSVHGSTEVRQPAGHTNFVLAEMGHV